jgi:hypothetical protein
MSFNTKGYIVIKQAIDKKIADFVYKYFLLKRKVAKVLIEHRFISPFETSWGTWKDNQVPNTYSHYGDLAMETLLQEVKPIMEKQTGLKLIPTYSYARIYKEGDILHKHKDRFSCEISTTLNLGGDKWPIFINPNHKEGVVSTTGYVPSKSNGVKVNLDPGDMLVYKGNILEHWRDAFKGKDCGQVFLHYNNAATKGSDKNKFDGRPMLGLPSNFKND